LTVVGVLAAVGVGSGVGRAADESTGSHGERIDADTARLIADAVAEYDAGRFEEARALFRSAHARSPNARTLRGIGMASFDLRDYVEATRTLDESLREKRRPLTAEQRRQVEALLARAETFIGRFTPRVDPPDAVLLVDGRPPRIEADGTVLLSFGHHRFTARCAGCTPDEKGVDLEVVGGERSPVELMLARASSAGVGVAPPGDLRPAIDDRAQDRSRLLLREGTEADSSARKATVLWVAGGALAALVGAGVAAVWWHDRQNELDACNAAEAGGERCTTDATISTQRNVAVGVTVGLGAAALTLGTVAAVLWSRRQIEHPQAVACSAGIGSMSCEIHF
jgi:hypothetical protein